MATPGPRGFGAGVCQAAGFFISERVRELRLFALLKGAEPSLHARNLVVRQRLADQYLGANTSLFQHGPGQRLELPGPNY